jgi:hypothetical protein
MSNDRLRDEVAGLKREMRQAWQEIAKRPIKVKGGGAAEPERRVIVYSGNTLATGQDGIVFSATPITDVPTAYDPNSAGTCIDGVGRGQLFTDGSFTEWVLVVNDGSGGTTIDFDLLGGSDSQDVASVATTKTATVAGDPLTTVTLYILKSLIG